MALEAELATYRNNVENWSDHMGEHVLIRGDEVAGFFSSYGDAVKAGYKTFGLEPFLVKRVSVVEQVHFIPPLMRSPDAALHPVDRQ